MNSKLTKLTKKGFMDEFFASVVSFAFFVMGLRDIQKPFTAEFAESAEKSARSDGAAPAISAVKAVGC